jgi:hypothetical protein
MYDVEGLVHTFCQAGFADPQSRGYLDSAIPRERSSAVEDASRVQDGAGICVEAVR